MAKKATRDRSADPSPPASDNTHPDPVISDRTREIHQLAEQLAADDKSLSMDKAWNQARAMVLNKPPKRTVSKATATTLDGFSEQIGLVKQFLKKMPASSDPAVRVCVNDVLQSEYDNRINIDYFLTFTDGELTVRRCEYLPQHDGHSELEVKRLEDYPTRDRVEIAAFVPQLLKAAKVAESEIGKKAQAATIAMQQAIAEIMGVGE